MALIFLTVIGVLVGVQLGLANTSIQSSNALAKQRNAVYAADSAMNAAIANVRKASNSTVGAQNGPSCNFSLGTAKIDGSNTSVGCTPTDDSGQSLGNTTAPGFAILTLAPFHSLAPTSGCVNVNQDEIGIVQVQNDKLLTVNGNVYVNSDADSDTWTGGCPNTGAAQHIQVIGDVRQGESCHDIDVKQPVPAVNPPYTNVCGSALVGSNPTNPYPAGADPAIANPTSWAPLISAPPAAGTITNSSGTPITTCPAANASGYRLVVFTPGSYTDATKLNNFMGGTCANAVFWFQPGVYYFNFTNSSGGHEWLVNDSSARVVGGQPTTLAIPGTSTGPTTWKATATAQSPSSTWTNPNGALAVDNNPATSNFSGTTSASGTTRTLTLSNFDAANIPAAASITNATLRVVHRESQNRITALTANVTPFGASACGAQTVTPSVSATAYATQSIDVTSCLNNPDKINGGPSVAFAETYVCTAGTSACASTTTETLDGIELDVTYSTGARPAWDPTNPASITSSAPVVPGACRHDGDAAWTDGVQFVFGGDSRVNLKSGSFELCDKVSTTQQEIVLYGVKSPVSAPVGPKTWKPGTATQTSGTWTSPNNSLAIDNSLTSTAFTGSSGSTRKLTMSGYVTNPASTIPTGSTINTVTLKVADRESSSRITGITATVTPSGASACTAQTVSPNVSASALTTATFDMSSCLNTAAKINGGASVLYSVTYACSSSCSSTTTAFLDGATLDVTYTPPAPSSPLNPQSGCIVQHPYYSPTNHAPGYNGACAVFKVETNANGGHSPRVAAFWGTVYAPAAALDVPVDTLTVPVFNRGVVARHAHARVQHRIRRLGADHDDPARRAAPEPQDDLHGERHRQVDEGDRRRGGLRLRVQRRRRRWCQDSVLEGLPLAGHRLPEDHRQVAEPAHVGLDVAHGA